MLTHHIIVRTFANASKVVGRTAILAPDAATARRTALTAVRKRAGIGPSVALIATVVAVVDADGTVVAAATRPTVTA